MGLGCPACESKFSGPLGNEWLVNQTTHATRNFINFDELIWRQIPAPCAQKWAHRYEMKRWELDLRELFIDLRRKQCSMSRWHETLVNSWLRDSKFNPHYILLCHRDPSSPNVEAQLQQWHEQTKPKHSSMLSTARSKRSHMEKWPVTATSRNLSAHVSLCISLVCHGDYSWYNQILSKDSKLILLAIPSIHPS